MPLHIHMKLSPNSSAFPESSAWTLAKTATADDFRGFLFHLMKAGRSRSTIRLVFPRSAASINFLSHVITCRTTSSPLLIYQKPEKQLPRFLTHSQVNSFLTAPGKGHRQRQAPPWTATRMKEYFRAFLFKRLQLTELVSLEVRDVDTISETVRVLGKGAKERSARWAGPRSRRSLVIAGKLACMLDRFSSISRVAGFRDARFGWR